MNACSPWVLRIAIVASGCLVVACSSGDGSNGSPDANGADDALPSADGGDPSQDGGPTPNPDGGNAPDTSVIVTPPGAVYGAKCTGTSANEAKATDEVAIVRGKAKLPAMNCVDAAMQAARNHSSYIGQNGWTLTHQEVMGKPGYTGVQFWDRLSYAGYKGSAAFEVVHSTADAHEAITGQNGWINTLYHRIPFVNYGTLDFGFGAATGGGQTSTVDFGSGNSASKTALTTWPPDGDTGVWTTFHNAWESPNPLPNQQVAGYPISVTGGGALAVTVHDITEGGNPVDHVMMNAANDPVKFIPQTQVYLIPKAVLKKSTKYTTHVTGTVSGSAFDVTVSFTTGSI
jgi:uncharacterized protein YkwD